MSTEIVWLPRARDDFAEIIFAIGRENEVAARRLMLRLLDKVDLLARFPKLGSRRDGEIAPFARVLVEGNYLILYRLDAEDDHPRRAEIVGIVDGRRDLFSLF